MLFEFVLWWYGAGWLGAAKSARDWVTKIERMFAVSVLLTSLFAPWKRIISPPGRSIDEKFRGAIDNLISRVVGFFARLAALVAAVCLMFVAGIAGLVMAAAWPLMPFLVIFFIFKGVSG